MLRLFIFLVTILVVRSQTTAVNRCIIFSGDLPLNVYIENCVTPPCHLPQLQDAVINIVFRAPRTMQSMSTLATAFLGILVVPYPLGQNAITCNFLQNSFCPILEGEVLIYKLKMYIAPTFPVGTQATVEFRVVDQNNSAFICIRVPILIVPAIGGSFGSRNSTAIASEH